MTAEYGPWLAHDGTGMPVTPDTYVQVEFRAPPLPGQINVSSEGAMACVLAWRHDGENDDVVRYRVRL